MAALVWDTSGILHAARAERLDVLGDLAKGHRHVMTAAVLEELDRYGLAVAVAECGWMETVHVDGLADLACLVRWTALVSDGQHDRGEATVCAWAEAHGGTAILDDAAAKATAVRAGLEVHGSLWVIADGVRSGHLSEPAADGLVDALARDGARFPFPSRGFSHWARAQDLF
ncbi:MAG TPA: hypothetical protein VF109_09345 [Mycobacteriales bacterium]